MALIVVDYEDANVSRALAEAILTMREAITKGARLTDACAELEQAAYALALSMRQRADLAVNAEQAAREQPDD